MNDKQQLPEVEELIAIKQLGDLIRYTRKKKEILKTLAEPNKDKSKKEVKENGKEEE